MQLVAFTLVDKVRSSPREYHAWILIEPVIEGFDLLSGLVGVAFYKIKHLISRGGGVCSLLSCGGGDNISFDIGRSKGHYKAPESPTQE